MTDETPEAIPTYNSYNQFVYAAAAAKALERKDKRTAENALEKLAVDMGVTDSDAQKAFMESYAYSDEALQNAVGIYSGKYFGGLYKQPIENIFRDHSNYVQGYVGDKEKEVIAEFGGETFEGINKKMQAASEIMQSKTDNFDDKKKKEAKEIMDKYGFLYQILTGIQNERIRSLHYPLEQETIREQVMKRYTPKETAETA
jgi:hypothetical protein